MIIICSFPLKKRAGKFTQLFVYSKNIHCVKNFILLIFNYLYFFLLNCIQYKNIFIYFCRTKINIMKATLLRSISKKTLIVGISSMVTFSFNAQNIGINSTGAAPDPSAGLDVDFTNKGLLIPRVGLTSASDAVTIPSPATSLLVYNTGTGGLTPAGYYYNAGTPGSPNWVQLLTSGSALSGSGVATRVAFWTGATSLGSNANLYWDNTNSRLGVGTAAPAQPLHVIGTGRFSAIASGPNNAIVTSNSSGDLGALNFTGSNTQFLLGNATWGTIGAGGVAPICGSPSANYVQKWTGTNLCNSIIFDNGTNVGIGTATPAQKLDVSGNVQFSGALMPAGNAGASGQILTSQGPGLPPTWQTPASIPLYGNNAQSVKLTTMVNTTSTSWVNIPGMSITMTPQHNKVYIFASVAARLTDNAGMAQYGQAVMFIRVLVNGIEQAISKCVITDYDDINGVITGGSAAISGVPVNVTIGSPITVTLQWYISRLWASNPWQLRCDPTLPNIGDHAVLTVFD
jgi:hypothetical protein